MRVIVCSLLLLAPAFAQKKDWGGMMDKTEGGMMDKNEGGMKDKNMGGMKDKEGGMKDKMGGMMDKEGDWTCEDGVWTSGEGETYEYPCGKKNTEGRNKDKKMGGKEGDWECVDGMWKNNDDDFVSEISCDKDKDMDDFECNPGGKWMDMDEKKDTGDKCNFDMGDNPEKHDDWECREGMWWDMRLERVSEHSCEDKVEGEWGGWDKGDKMKGGDKDWGKDSSDDKEWGDWDSDEKDMSDSKGDMSDSEEMDDKDMPPKKTVDLVDMPDFESLAEFSAWCGRISEKQKCKDACYGRVKKKSCSPKIKNNTIKCSKIAVENVCNALGCSFKKKNSKCKGRPSWD